MKRRSHKLSTDKVVNLYKRICFTYVISYVIKYLILIIRLLYCLIKNLLIENYLKKVKMNDIHIIT